MSEKILEISFIWILRIVCILSFFINVSFYCFLFCRWRLSKNTHWFLCNFAISELIRSLATLTSGVIWERLMDMENERSFDENRRSSDEDKRSNFSAFYFNEQFPNSFESIDQVKAIVDDIRDICFATTCIFALLILLQFYFYLKSPWSIQTLDLRGVALVICVWLGIIAYIVLVSTFADSSDKELIFVKYNSYVSIIIDGLHLLGYFVLFCLTYRLFYLNRIELLSNVYCVDVGLLRSIFDNRRKGIRYLLLLIVFVSISSVGSLFDSLSEFIIEIRSKVLMVVYVEKSFSIYMFLLGIVWPFVWIYLDVGLGKELRKAAKYLKLPTKIENTLASNSMKQVKPCVYNPQLPGQIREAVI